MTLNEAEYRVVELTTVTDDQMEAVLNREAEAGFRLEGLHFAMREASHRPSMAFMIFVRPRERADAQSSE